MIDQILECLERKRTRATYSALGEVIGSFRTRTPSGRSSQFPCAKAPRARRGTVKLSRILGFWRRNRLSVERRIDNLGSGQAAD